MLRISQIIRNGRTFARFSATFAPAHPRPPLGAKWFASKKSASDGGQNHRFIARLTIERAILRFAVVVKHSDSVIENGLRQKIANRQFLEFGDLIVDPTLIVAQF